jgi:hypothetical protein
MARTFVIGDVHGCIDELDRLLERFALTRGDEVVLVGDLVNKGPDSVEVVRRCIEIGAKAVLGNHDDLLLRCVAARREDDDDEFPDGIRKIARKLADDELAWMEDLPLLRALPAHDVLVTHAGLRPGLRPERQDRSHLLTMRSIRADGSASKRIDEGVPWASLWTGPEHVLFGHDAVRGLQEWPYATGLDTGCVYGGRLTAVELPGRRLVSVQAKKAYAEPGRTLEKRR